MQEFKLKNLKIMLNKLGLNRYSKLSYPARYGQYNEIETPDYVYQFNLNGRIKYLYGRNRDWPHGDWLKLTASGDWVYYTAGEYSNIFGYTGEYYLPCFSYPGNSIFPYRPFENKTVRSAVESLNGLNKRLKDLPENSLPDQVMEFLGKVKDNITRPDNFDTDNLHEIIGSEISVLPPDTRHADYDVLPVIIADGCLYNCGFCMVKSGRGVTLRTKDNIVRQIGDLKYFYGNDIFNYNSVFLGNHDSLYAGADSIEFAAMQSYESFRIKQSLMKDPKLFLFGSVFSFLSTDERTFKMLNNLPFYSYINIGLESADQEGLDMLGKPVKENEIKEAFCRMNEINDKYGNVEVTANFILSLKMPDSHCRAIEKIISDELSRKKMKGCIYFSPMPDGSSVNEMRKKFLNLKHLSRLPAYVYLIQRL